MKELLQLFKLINYLFSWGRKSQIMFSHSKKDRYIDNKIDMQPLQKTILEQRIEINKNKLNK